MGILAVSEDGVQRTLEPSESIIWNLLMAKAENVYGIRLMNSGSRAKWEVLESLCDILRDELIRLDKNKKDGEEKFKDLISELEILSEYGLFRYCHDTGWDDDEGSKEITQLQAGLVVSFSEF